MLTNPDKQSKTSVSSVGKSSVESVARNILVLIDASALIYRAFYALPPLTTKDGALVNAVYGFASAILRAVKELHPEYIAVAFDSKEPTFRHKEFKEYKATRPKPPAEMIKQIPLVKEVCQVLNMPTFQMPGYEADDIIGTIVNEIQNAKIKNQNDNLTMKQFNNEAMSTIIVTGDMDTLQLVDENTRVYSLARGIQRAEIYDSGKVRDKYGFGPEQVVDYKALRGDPSDNIPGVPGIGEKTATELIKTFGNIENMYKKIQIPNNPSTLQQIQGRTESNRSATSSGPLRGKLQISSKLQTLLNQYKKQAFLSKHLVTIVQAVPINFILADCKVHDYDQDKAIKLLKKLEFKSLIGRLPKVKVSQEQGRLF